MRSASSTSRGSKRSRSTKNMAKSSACVSRACLNRKLRGRGESGARGKRPVNTLGDRIHSAKDSTVQRVTFLSLASLWHTYSRRSLLRPQWKRRGDLFYTPFERLLTDGAEQAPSMPYTWGTGRIIRKNPIGFITPSVPRPWFICRYNRRVKLARFPKRENSFIIIYPTIFFYKNLYITLYTINWQKRVYRNLIK